MIGVDGRPVTYALACGEAFVVVIDDYDCNACLCRRRSACDERTQAGSGKAELHRHQVCTWCPVQRAHQAGLLQSPQVQPAPADGPVQDSVAAACSSVISSLRFSLS